jgi:hypothetical protein
LNFSNIVSDYAQYASLGTLRYQVVLESLEATINLFTFPLAQLPNVDFTMTDTEKAAAVAAIEQQYPGVGLQLTDNNGLNLGSAKLQNYNGIEYFQTLLIPALAFREFRALDTAHTLNIACVDVGNGNLQTGDYIVIDGTLSLTVTLERPGLYNPGDYGSVTFTTPSILAGATVIVSQAIVNTAFVDQVSVSSAARVRCYRDTASATADLSRASPAQYQQENVSGLCFDINLGTGVNASGNPITALSAYLRTNTVMRSAAANVFSITNTGSAATTILVTLNFEVIQ